MKKIRLALALAGSFTLPLVTHAQFAGTVVSYNSGSGFAAGFTNASAALGAPASGAGVTPFAPPFSKSQIVSIGAGGEITLQLDTPLSQGLGHPYGVDFNIFANEFFTSSAGNVSGLFFHANSTLVQVSPNGSSWFTLNPALAPQVGELFPTDGAGNPSIPVDPSLTLASFSGNNLAGIRSLYNGSAGGTGYNLAWAQDAGGNSVTLASVDFVRLEVATGVVDLDAITAVPEPGAFALLLTSLALLICRRFSTRNRRQSKPSFQLLKKMVFIFLGASSIARADTITIDENFSTDPAADGWQTFGDSSLFQWNSTNHDLAVTWDSSHTNSYYYHPIGTFLTSGDDFTISFDLLLHDAAIDGGTFELAAGFLNLSNAISPGFLRGTGYNATNVVEFDYFMDPFFGNSLAASELDASGLIADVYDNLDLATNTTYHVSINHIAGMPLISAQVTVSNQLYSALPFSYTEQGFGDFRVDTISISSYSDENAYGASILAHGTIANLSMTATTHPVAKIRGSFVGAAWQVQFTSRINWLYVLKRTSDFRTWTSASPTVNGTDDTLILEDTNPPVGKAFYRVLAFQSPSS
jgi:hypothetical protein